jgi:hypothetical protein
MAWAREMPDRVITKYEAKAIQQGRIPYYFVYKRNHQPAPDVPVIQELEMPHVVFTSPLTLDEMFTRASKVVGEDKQNNGIYINIMDAYRSAGGALLFEVHVGEPTIDQRLALMVLERWRDKNPAQEYTIQLNTMGHPRPTHGVHKAVALLAERLLKLHPEARILSQKLRDKPAN